jgi:hypothetical protein
VTGLRVGLRIQDGDGLAGTLRVENAGDEAVRAASPLSPAALNVVVFDHLWNAVQPEARGKVHVAHDELSLAPGEAREFELASLAFTTGTAAFAYDLRPGRHFAVALYHPGSSRRPDESDYRTVVASDVTTFDVAQ